MAKKYDTNPLEQDAFEKAEREFARKTSPTMEAETRNFESRFNEAQTRSFVNSNKTTAFEDLSAPYQSQFASPQQGFPQTQKLTDAFAQSIEKPTSRKVAGFGLPENLAMILPYLPFTFGAIFAVIELLLTKKHETKVRFHAAQGLALHLVWILAAAVVASLSGISSSLAFGGRLFSLGITIFFIVSIFRVYKGKPHHIEALDEVTDFLNEKLRPGCKSD